MFEERIDVHRIRRRAELIEGDAGVGVFGVENGFARVDKKA